MKSEIFYINPIKKATAEYLRENNCFHVRLSVFNAKMLCVDDVTLHSLKE